MQFLLIKDLFVRQQWCEMSCFNINIVCITIAYNIFTFSNFQVLKKASGVFRHRELNSRLRPRIETDSDFWNFRPDIPTSGIEYRFGEIPSVEIESDIENEIPGPGIGVITEIDTSASKFRPRY